VQELRQCFASGLQAEPVEDVEAVGDSAEVDDGLPGDAAFAKDAEEDDRAPDVGEQIGGGEIVERAVRGAVDEELLTEEECRESSDEEDDTGGGVEGWSFAAHGEGYESTGAEELELHEAVDPDIGAACREVRQRDVGRDEHDDREADRSGTAEVLSGGGPEEVELLFDGDAPERAGWRPERAFAGDVPVTGEEKECK